jgi:hypothetical protein
MDEIYNIEKYTEEELFTMLDLNNPSDRELEMKLLTTIDRYAEIEGEDSNKIKAFFQEAYDYFFPSADASEEREGMETTQITRAHHSAPAKTKTKTKTKIKTKAKAKTKTKNSKLSKPPT